LWTFSYVSAILSMIKRRLLRAHTVKVWFRKFKAGNFDIEDEPRSGRPIEVDCEQLKHIIDQDRNVSTRTIALELDICQKTIDNALKRINVTFKFNRWVPHELTAERKRKREAACLALLGDQRKEKILDRFVICDEKMGVLQQYKP
ncbi:Histone-lysine N-methyltransferase SETMAR, partial [Araneus ventricosus]